MMKQLQPIRILLLILSILGFSFINIPFIYITFFENEIYREAMNNSLALVFMGEAFLLMFLIAFLIHKLELRKPGWMAFIALSLVGSLAFSIPLFLYLHTEPTEAGADQ